MISALNIREKNLSLAWAKAFLSLMQSGGSQRHPATIVIDGLDGSEQIEIPELRERLDRELKKAGQSQCETVSGTIFPQSMWNESVSNDADLLFARYEKAWPGIAKCPANRRGVYFRRLSAFESVGHSGEPVNQLKFIIETFRGGNHRKSALQASILDPTRDHTNNKQKGFPCLQQVAFTPLEKERLSVTGFYATQYQFEKAYGNYLGLYRLGRFMAKQLGLQLSQVVCTAAVLSRGDGDKSHLADFEKDIRRLAVAAGLTE